MPVYRYTPALSPCKLCGDGFEHTHRASDPALTACPTCGQNVQREGVNSFTTPKLLRPLSVSSAKSAGFTVLKRVSDGAYERQ